MDTLAVASDLPKGMSSLDTILDDTDDLVVLEVVNQGLGVFNTVDDVVKAVLGASMDLLVDDVLDLVGAETLAGSSEDAFDLADELFDLTDGVGDLPSLDVAGDLFGVSDDSFEGGNAWGALLEGGGDAESEDDGD